MERTSFTLFNLRGHPSSEVPHVFFVLKVFDDFSWTVYIGSKMVCAWGCHCGAHCLLYTPPIIREM